MESKTISDDLVDVLVKFRDYCESQGEDNPLSIIDNICGDIQILSNVVVNLWPIVTEAMGIPFVMTIFGAEQIIDSGLKVGMSRGKYYKEIYKDVRKKVELFAELHGKSEVISKQLSLEDTK